MMLMIIMIIMTRQPVMKNNNYECFEIIFQEYMQIKFSGDNENDGK